MVTDRTTDLDNAPACQSFLADARHNLAAIRRMYGARSRRYRRQLRLYRAVADALGCRRALERLAHPLAKRRHRPAHPARRCTFWSRSRHICPVE